MIVTGRLCECYENMAFIKILTVIKKPPLVLTVALQNRNLFNCF